MGSMETSQWGTKMIKKTVLFLLAWLIFLFPSFALDRKTTDLISIIRVPAVTTPGAIRPDRPSEITALRKESDNIYDPASKTFICIMTVEQDDFTEMQDLIRTFPDKEVEEITAEKEAAIRLEFPTFDNIKATVEENIEFAGETEAERKARKNP